MPSITAVLGLEEVAGAVGSIHSSLFCLVYTPTAHVAGPTGLLLSPVIGDSLHTLRPRVCEFAILHVGWPMAAWFYFKIYQSLVRGDGTALRQTLWER